MAGQKDRQILFHGILPATASSLKLQLQMKVTDIEYEVGLTISYCITVSMQKISLIHMLILKIQQILGSHELNKLPSPF